MSALGAAALVPNLRVSRPSRRDTHRQASRPAGGNPTPAMGKTHCRMAFLTFCGPDSGGFQHVHAESDLSDASYGTQDAHRDLKIRVHGQGAPASHDQSVKRWIREHLAPFSALKKVI